MKEITIQIFEDPGHGWARFPRLRLNQLGIGGKITNFSYERGDNVFLEEDCDLNTLITALKNRGYTVKFKTHHTDRTSKIRNYKPYSPRFVL